MTSEYRPLPTDPDGLVVACDLDPHRVKRVVLPQGSAHDNVLDEVPEGTAIHTVAGTWTTIGRTVRMSGFRDCS
jgi:hypothetical protein